MSLGLMYVLQSLAPRGPTNQIFQCHCLSIVRASSLGTATTDLSCEYFPIGDGFRSLCRRILTSEPVDDYAIAAIWANAELHLSIIASNLAVSHAIFLFFSSNRPFSSKSRSSSNPSRSYGRHGYPERSRHGYLRSHDLHSPGRV